MFWCRNFQITHFCNTLFNCFLWCKFCHFPCHFNRLLLKGVMASTDLLYTGPVNTHLTGTGSLLCLQMTEYRYSLDYNARCVFCNFSIHRLFRSTLCWSDGVIQNKADSITRHRTTVCVKWERKEWHSPLNVVFICRTDLFVEIKAFVSVLGWKLSSLILQFEHTHIIFPKRAKHSMFLFFAMGHVQRKIKDYVLESMGWISTHLHDGWYFVLSISHHD